MTNIEKLPKWAQQEIKVLKMKLGEARKELYRIHENPESNTIMGSNHVMRDEKIKYLPDNQRITFVLPSGEVMCHIKGDYLEVYSSGDGDMYIRPHVSNVIQIHHK